MSRRQKINAEIMKCERELDALLGAMLGPRADGSNRVDDKLTKVKNVLGKIPKEGATGVLADAIIAAINTLPRITRIDTAVGDFETIAAAARAIGVAVSTFAATAPNASTLQPYAEAISAAASAYASADNRTVDALNILLRKIGKAVRNAPVAGLETYLRAIGDALETNKATAGLTN